ncbi:uncharacterized protein ACIBXB_001637 [Morphnus guianensis]
MWFDKFLLCFHSISAGPLEDSVCGLIGAGMAASCLHSIIPSRGTSGFSSCLRGACSRWEKLFRGPSSSPLLPLAAAAPWVCEVPPTLCSAETSRNPWQTPAQRSRPPPGLSLPSRGSQKSPVLPQTGSSNFPAPPGPLHLLRACTSAASPPAYPPPGCFSPPFSPPSFPLQLRSGAHCVWEPPDLSLALGLSFVFAFRERETAAELSPTAGPGAAGKGDGWCLRHGGEGLNPTTGSGFGGALCAPTTCPLCCLQAAILSAVTCKHAVRASHRVRDTGRPRGRENAGDVPAFPWEEPGWLRLSPKRGVCCPPGERRGEERGCPKRGQAKYRAERSSMAEAAAAGRRQPGSRPYRRSYTPPGFCIYISTAVCLCRSGNVRLRSSTGINGL